MPTEKGIPPSNKVLVTPAEAAELLSVSLDFLKSSVLPEIRVIRRGRSFVRIHVDELHAWSRRNSAVQ